VGVKAGGVPRLCFSPPSQPFPATASVEGAQFNVPPFPATVSAEGAQFNVPPSPPGGKGSKAQGGEGKSRVE